MSDDLQHLSLRALTERDAQTIARAFTEAGIHAPAQRFLDYHVEQRCGIRSCWVAWLDARVVGYVTLHWIPLYAAIAGKGIPEIQDLNVLPAYRRRGIASRLLERAEQEAFGRSAIVAIGVGLHPDGSGALRLYVKRGYVPDGLGVTYDDRYVQSGELVRVDGDLVLHLTKALAPSAAGFRP